MIMDLVKFGLVPAAAGTLVFGAQFDEANRDVFLGSVAIAGFLGGSIYLSNMSWAQDLRDKIALMR